MLGWDASETPQMTLKLKSFSDDFQCFLVFFFFRFLSSESELCPVQAQTILHTLIHITSSCFCTHISIDFSLTDAERVQA